MENNLIIGKTSQLSYYFPNEYERISSRNINYGEIKKKRYKRIYLLFAEQRTFLSKNVNFFNEINFKYTLEVIDNLIDVCDNIVIYSTSELWNSYEGPVSVNKPFKYNHTPYIESKEKISNYIKNNRPKYQKVIIVYPFNFNSIYRKKGFLFNKIFNSLINDEKISIGDVNFYRDIIHPKIIVNESIKTKGDILVGSGELYNVKKFIQDLFRLHKKDFNDYIKIDEKNNLKNKRNGYFCNKKYSDYKELLKLTIEDINGYKIS